jgi:DNA-binding transcriptional LysR family regulator
MLSLVGEQACVAMLPRSGLEGTAGVAAVNLTHPRVERHIELVWRADHTPPAARAFPALATRQLTDN